MNLARCLWSSGPNGRICLTTTPVSYTMSLHYEMLTRRILAVVSLVAAILPLVALFQVFDGLSAIAGGVLRAIGKQFTGALLNLSSYYVIGACHILSPQHLMLMVRMIGIPFGIWLAFWRDMHLHGLWVGLTISLVYSAAAGVWLSLRTDWDREVEKVRIRLEADRKDSLRAADIESEGSSR